jgi:hypothetical protein
MARTLIPGSQAGKTEDAGAPPTARRAEPDHDKLKDDGLLLRALLLRSRRGAIPHGEALVGDELFAIGPCILARRLGGVAP